MSSAPTRSSSHQVPTLSVATKDEELVPPTPVKADIVVPPSPKNHLLPESETAGVTSGAVQPPGSTGNEHDDEVVSTPTSDEEGGEHTSDVAAQEEDDEDRLILQGGNGIPIVVRILRLPKILIMMINPIFLGWHSAAVVAPTAARAQGAEMLGFGSRRDTITFKLQGRADTSTLITLLNDVLTSVPR